MHIAIRVRSFASLREALGAEELLDVPESSTVAMLRDRLIAASEVHAQALARTRAVRCSLNQRLCTEDTIIPAEAEVAFFPPVTGG